MNQKIVALIPLKGQSRSIPRKNIKPLAGKPLCYWVCAAAAKSKYIKDIYVSTEDDEIRDIVNSFNLNIKIIPEKLIEEKDISVLESVIMGFMGQVNDFDILMTMQATSPLTTADDIDRAIEKFIKHDYDSLLTGVLFKKFFWSLDGTALNYDHKNRPLRQNFDGTIMENGAFWLTKKEIIERERNRLGGRIGIYEMPPHTELQIDDLEDWDKAEILINKTNDKL